MKRLTCALLFFATISAYGQDVTPPPRPDAIDPALAPILESLKQALLSSGRVEYSYVTGGSTVKLWRRITSVVVDAPGCQVRVHYDTSVNGGDPRDVATSVFFESIDTAEALSLQAGYDRGRSRLGQPSQITYSGEVYALYINGVTASLMFPEKSHASEAAKALNGAAQICRTQPVAPNTTAGAPGLAETFQFIVDKLNDNGAVNFRSMYQASNGAYSALSRSFRITEAVANPATCLIRLNSRQTSTALTPVQTADTSPQTILRSAQAGDNKETVTADNPDVLSVRRIEKLEVSRNQDLVTVGAGMTYTENPVVYALKLTYLGGAANYYYFRDEDMANRLAKAMSHAVELCGGGNKDPF